MICNNRGGKEGGDNSQARDHYSADNTGSQSARQNQNKGKSQSGRGGYLCMGITRINWDSDNLL